MGAYPKGSRNKSEARFGKSVQNGETPKHLKFKWKRDFQSLKVMCWNIWGHVERRKRHCPARSKRGIIL